MTDEILDFIFSSKSKPIHRRIFFEENFLYFCLYYFPGEFSHELADFQKEYLSSLQKGESIFFVGFRECGKSMFLTMYYIWVLCYAKKHFIMHYNSEIEQAKSMLRDVVTILQENEKIIGDFGYLYLPESRSQRDKKQKTIGEFITENGVKVKAMSIGKSPRGQKFVYKSITYRPDLVSFDDIDTQKNTKSVDMIEEDVNFILGEVFGGVTAYAQFILLGNVIREIGRVPSLKVHFESDKKIKVKIFWIPIQQNGKITWSRFVNTDSEADEKNTNITNPKERFISLETIRRNQGSIGYNQNYNLIAYAGGETIIKREYIHWRSDLPTKMTAVTIGIDPASSTKNFSDSFAIVVVGHLGMRKIILETRELKGQDKGTENILVVLAELYQKYHVSQINIEFVSLQREFCEYLYNLLRNHNFAVRKIVPTKDKVARLSEWEGAFSRGDVEFVENMGNKNLVAQLLKFPNVEHDDLVDAMVYGFEYRKPAKFGIVETQNPFL